MVMSMKILFQLNPYNQQRQQEKPRWIYPIKLAMYATYLRNQGHQVIWDWIGGWSSDRLVTSENDIDVPFLDLPPADRVLTDAMNPKWQQNGNFKHLPGTYIMSANGCWHGKCSFCVEKGVPYEVRPVGDVISEIDECVAMGFKEVFDDSGTFPIQDWLWNFYQKMRTSGLYKNLRLSCNMRFGVLDKAWIFMMKHINFRMLLYGLESANQKTLNKINKGIDIDKAVKELKIASKAGLENHIAVMFGFPWETDQDAIRTLKLVWWLLKKGYAKTAQASFYCPPDGIANESHRKYVPRIYNVIKYPSFWFNKIRDIKDINDLKYFWKCLKAGTQR